MAGRLYLYGVEEGGTTAPHKHLSQPVLARADNARRWLLVLSLFHTTTITEYTATTYVICFYWYQTTQGLCSA